MKHKVKINVADRSGKATDVLKVGRRSIPKRIARFLFGDFSEVMVLKPGKTVVGVEICEQEPGCTEADKGGESNEG